MSHNDRIVVLVDMDCFYCQVEEKLNPDLEGKPIAVVQYNAWKGGGIIAVNYPARDKGVTRHMRGDDAKKVCPEIQLARVPNVRGKADLTKYREAGQRVAEVLQTFTPLLERASVDEAYLDITDIAVERLEKNNSKPFTIDAVPNTHVVNCDTADFLHNINTNSEFCESNRRLAVGGMIVEEIRREVLIRTGYKCSAGIAHNKILAKLVCGLHKPNKQTILPQESVPLLYKDLPIKKIKSLGGKFGNSLAEELNISMMGELIKFSEKELIKKFDAKTGKWLYNIARGIDLDPVTTRLTSKSIGCCKTFPGNANCLKTPENVEHWLNELATEISERLEKDLKENRRKAKQMVVSFTQVVNGTERSSSRTHPLNSYSQSRIAKDSIDVIKKHCKKIDDNCNITFLGISVGNFQEMENNRSISSFFKNINEINNSKCTTRTEKNDSLQRLSNYSTAMYIINDSCGELAENKSENDHTVDSKRTNSSFLQNAAQSTEELVKNSLENDVENTSVYSATTEELDEDPKAYIYYEDIFPLASPKKLLEGSELRGELELVEKSRPTSFFGKYFDSTTDDSITSTSSIEVFENCKNGSLYEETPFTTISEDEVCFADEKTNITNDDDKKICNDKQICLDCNKQILVSEMAAHRDYHFALKLVRSEAHLYNPPMPLKSSNPSKPRNKSQMKKNNVNVQAGSISKFLQPASDSGIKNISPKYEVSKQETQGIKRKTSDRELVTSVLSNERDVENGEFCSECKRRVELKDVVNHNDYHLAKKLHAELNATLKLNEDSRKISSGLPKDKKLDISTYFKKK